MHTFLKGRVITQRIRLVLNSGETDQRVVTATIVRTEALADLAVLKCDDRNLPSPLGLGHSGDLVETTPVTAFWVSVPARTWQLARTSTQTSASAQAKLLHSEERLGGC